MVTYSQRTTGGRSFTCSRRTAAHLDDTKARLTRSHSGAYLQIIQGCNHKGWAPSAGTHDYDAVLDLRIIGLDWWTAQRFLRECGWACWYRYLGSWAHDQHIHAVSLGYTTRVGIYVPAQVDDYYRHALGLRGQHNSGLDHSRFPPNIKATIFDYAAYERDKEANMPLNDADKKWLTEAIDKGVNKSVAKYFGDVVPWPIKGKPNNTVWGKTALSRIFKAMNKK